MPQTPSDQQASLQPNLAEDAAGGSSIVRVFLIFLRLGCTSFGGPTAHLGYFEQEFVERRRWLSATAFGELIALSQSLPGPSSSQVGFAIGVLRGGVAGGFAAWLGFTLPSALLMLGFAFSSRLFASAAGIALLHGLQLVAVAVVASAVLTMQRTLAPDRPRLAVTLCATAAALLLPAFLANVLIVTAGAVAGNFLLPRTPIPAQRPPTFRVSRRTSVGAAAVFLLLLLVTATLPSASNPTQASLFTAFFRAGAMVFGGGHVVLPMLQALVVTRGWVTPEAFIAGYGAAQALPGPLFTFAAFLGAAAHPASHSVLNGIIALLAIFLPGTLLMLAVLPFWGALRSHPRVAAALTGINASVVGILIAALYQSVWTPTVHTAVDFLIALAAFLALTAWRAAPWAVALAVGGVCCLLRLMHG